MSSSSKRRNKALSSDAFVKKVASDYAQFRFEPGQTEHWSPRTNTITYNPGHSGDDLRFGMLHELAHGLLGHTRYNSDFELLKMESLAWAEAAKIGRRYGVIISPDHIQNCLDTYRDWLHRRSTCPSCGAHGLQTDNAHYQCFNCRHSWRVSSRRFARSYRLSKTT